MNQLADAIVAMQRKIDELREELATLKAQPVQEPVAWMYQCTADKSGPVLLQKKKNWAESGTGLWIETPLYAAPVQLVQPAPLTNAQIDAVVYQCRAEGDDSTYSIVREAIKAALRTGGAG